MNTFVLGVLFGDWKSLLAHFAEDEGEVEYQNDDHTDKFQCAEPLLEEENVAEKGIDEPYVGEKCDESRPLVLVSDYLEEQASDISQTTGETVEILLTGVV